MARTIEDFWKLLEEIQGTSTDLTDSVKAIAKNEKTVSQTLFSNIIDQSAYNSRDYQRIRSFLRDWYAAHRSLTTFQFNISDLYQMPNDQLDDLFQSFGYNLSSSLRDPVSNNTPVNKINFFLDLVNLYKIKGTPQALFNVLEYYGLIDVDIYEVSLQYDDRLIGNPSDIIFKGKKIIGTTITDTSPIYLPFSLLTESDPHWMQSESTIKALVSSNKINFPSQSPYFVVRPSIDEQTTTVASSILQNTIQDQYDTWENAGFPPEDTNPLLDQNAAITILDEESSVLTLYLSCIYIFNKEYEVGAPGDRFICYDGTNTTTADIIAEYEALTSKPITRLEIKEKYSEYINTFSRDIALNFLQTHADAGIVLAALNPSIKANLDSLTNPTNTILGSLLNDLGEWVRSNISLGFINLGYILFGIDSLFSQLRDVIDFFKPYRARVIPLELIQFRNRLMNTIIIEEEVSTDGDLIIRDFLVGDSVACCSDSTCSDLYHPREYYDCGSYFDIGAVVDYVLIDNNEVVNDYLACPHVDTTGYVVSEFSGTIPDSDNIVPIEINSDEITITFDTSAPSADYSTIVNIFNEVDASPSSFSYIVTNKTTDEFSLLLSGVVPTANYYLSWSYSDATNTSGIELIPNGLDEVSIVFDSARSNVDYAITLTLSNTVDVSPSTFLYTITNKDVNGFTVKFSDVMPSNNYYIEWTTSEYGRINEFTSDIGYYQIPFGVDNVTIPFSFPYDFYDNYTLGINIINTDDTSISHYSFITTNKDTSSFTVTLSGITNTSNYYISWSEPVASTTFISDYLFSQTGSIRGFDDGGTFDCTYSGDVCVITVEEIEGKLLLETGDLLLQENGSSIYL